MDAYKEVLNKLSAGMSKENADLLKEIVSENFELRLEVEKCAKQLNKLSEEYEQERYSMRNKLETMVHMEAHYGEEIASLQDQLQRERNKSDESKTQETDLRKLKTKIEELSNQLEVSQKRGEELKERLIQCQEEFSEYRQGQEGGMDQHSLMVSEDYLQLQYQVTTLQDTQTMLQGQLEESERNLKTVIHEKTTVQSLVLAKGEEIEEMRAEISSYCNTLEKAREENMEFKVQLENLQLETTDHGEKGNSLFGELDDRRMQAETKLVSLLEQYQTAKHQLDREKQQHHRLKVQMTTLLQTNSGSVSSERLSRMETLIYQLKTEKETLLTKIRRYETSQKDEIDQLMTLQQKSGEGDNKQDYTQFLTAVLHTKQAEITRLKEEIHQQNLSLLLKDDKVIECNRKIFQLETDFDKAQKIARKQALKIEELHIRYEPEANEKKVMFGLREKIPMGDEEEEAGVVLKEHFPLNLHMTADQSALHLTFADTTADGSPEPYRSCLLLQSPSGAWSLPDEKGFSLSSELAQADKLFQTGKQVKILDTVSVISSDGGKSDVVKKEGNEKENRAVVKKGPKGVVHHNVKKVSSANIGPTDKSQCNQQ